MRAGNAGSTGPVIRCRHGRAARWRGSVKTECFVARQTTICSFSLVIRIARLPGNSSSSRGLDGLAKGMRRCHPWTAGMLRAVTRRERQVRRLRQHAARASGPDGIGGSGPAGGSAAPACFARCATWPASPVLPGRPGVRQVWFALDGPAGPVLSSSSARCGRAVLFPVWCLPRLDCSARIHGAEGRGLGPPCARIAGWRCHGHDARMFACVDG